jgi:hypothetical protein
MKSLLEEGRPPKYSFPFLLNNTMVNLVMFASPLAKQYESKKHKFTVVGETIVFSVCNKPFKPLGIPSRLVKSHKGLPAMTPTNIFQHYVIGEHELPHKHIVFISQADLTN